MGVLTGGMGLVIPSKWTNVGSIDVADGITISNGAEGQSEITFDYLHAEGGLPFFETSRVVSVGGPVVVDVLFSETFEGLNKITGMQL